MNGLMAILLPLGAIIMVATLMISLGMLFLAVGHIGTIVVGMVIILAVPLAGDAAHPRRKPDLVRHSLAEPPRSPAKWRAALQTWARASRRTHSDASRGRGFRAERRWPQEASGPAYGPRTGGSSLRDRRDLSRLRPEPRRPDSHLDARADVHPAAHVHAATHLHAATHVDVAAYTGSR